MLDRVHLRTPPRNGAKIGSATPNWPLRNVSPEAEWEPEPGSTIYIRVPASLKRDVDEAAKKSKMSGNMWAMRCIERCLDFPPQLAEIFCIVRELTVPWSTDTIGEDKALDEYKLQIATKALNEVGELIESFAKERFGTSDLSKISGAESVLSDPDISRGYQPYPG